MDLQLQEQVVEQQDVVVVMHQELVELVVEETELQRLLEKDVVQLTQAVEEEADVLLVLVEVELL